MIANGNKSYLSYLNKLVNEYSNTYHCSIGKNVLMIIILLWIKPLNQVTKHLNLKLVIESGLKYKNILTKVTPKIVQEKHLLIILC